MNSWRVALTFAIAAFILWRNLPGAILFLFPRLMRARGEDESWPKVDRELFARMEEELAPIGFKRLGVHVERAPLRRGEVAYDFVHEGEKTWGTAFGRGDDVRLVLVTPLDAGAFVLTADHRLMSQDKPGLCLAGGMPGVQPEQLLAAHRRRVERLREAGRSVATDLSLEARVKAANAWFASWGRRELRAKHLNGLLMTTLGIGIAVMLLWAAVRQS